MLKPAFSTVACPEWTLSQVADRAQALGFEAVELRTFGENSNRFACDPSLTAGDKVRRIFGQRGIEILSLATGAHFEQRVWPPVIGHVISDTEQAVRDARRAIDLAVAIEAPFVRVFGFDIPSMDTRKTAIKRIAQRLAMVVDHADKTGIRVVLENGGGFNSAQEQRELIEAVNSPLLGAAYSIAVGAAAGDLPGAAIRVLGDRLWVARVKDLRDGRPCELGRGTVPCEAFARALNESGFGGPLVFEWDRAWNPDLAPAPEALTLASGTIWSWLGGRLPAAAVPAHPTSPQRAPAIRR